MSEAVDFTYAAGESHGALTFYALAVAVHLEEPFRALLLLLADCVDARGSSDLGETGQAGQLRSSAVGASYERLDAIARAASMDEAERIRWRRVAESVPLSERHASHIEEKLRERAA